MEAYTDFADVYDELMDDTPYTEWCNRLVKDMETYGISRPDRGAEDPIESEKNLVLDLACGTGTLTEMLYERGYDMIGADFSGEMLMKAMEKKERTGSEILYLQQDMRELDLYCTVGTVISVCDSLNYLLEKEDLEQTFSLVHRFLHPGGLFLFDVNTDYKYREVIGDATIAENREDCSFIWDNYFHEDEHINEYDLTIFVRCDEEKELFQRFTETHYQRGYTLDEMKELVEKAGLIFACAIDADTHGEPSKDSERIYIVARENGKKL